MPFSLKENTIQFFELIEFGAASQKSILYHSRKVGGVYNVKIHVIQINVKRSDLLPLKAFPLCVGI